MIKKQKYVKGRLFVLFFILLVLTAFMMLAMSMRAAADDERSSSGEGGIYNVFPNAIMEQASPPKPADISDLEYDINTRILTLSGANVQGTLQFNSYQNQTGDEMITANYTIMLAPGTTSRVYALKLMDEVEVTIKGEGELVVQAPNKNTDYGAALTFNDTFKRAAPKLIMEGGTVTIDSTHHGFTIKEAGCLYLKEGVKSVTFIGKTETDGTKLSVIPSKNKLEGNESVPKVFSDIPCLAQYVPYVNGGKEVVISPNGTSSQSGDKTLSDASLLRDDDQYYILTFKPGYTVTWQNDDVNQTVLEKDNVFYWPGQTPEYNGNTPTKAPDAQYTYTFSNWSPTPAAIYKDTTYKAVYTTKVNSYTVTFDANGHGTAPASQTIDYGQTIAKPADLTEIGYTFGGWYKEAACVTAYDFSTKVTADITLYAKWNQGGVITEVIPKTPDTPRAVVTGMEVVASRVITAQEREKIASGEISVDVKIEAEKMDEASAEGAQEIKMLLAPGNSVSMFLDLSLFKNVVVNSTGTTTSNDIGSVNNVVLRIQIPYDTARQNIQILRYHNTAAQAFTKLEADPTEGYADGTYFVGNGFVVLYASGFSTYAIADSGYAQTTSTETKKETTTETKKETTTETILPIIPISFVKHTKNSLKLMWEPTVGAEGYDIFAACHGYNLPARPTMTVIGNSAVVKKAYKKTGYKKITKGCVDYIIRAYRTVSGKKQYIAETQKNYTIGAGSCKNSDAKKITVKKGIYNIPIGKTGQIKAKVKTRSGKKQINNAKGIRYISSNTAVAAVNRKGKILGVSKGSCYIYVIASNGLTKKLLVNVR